ncbi:MAG: desulfoferrodoxin [Candidatus Methanomethylicaceae archaeon]|nr:desulfoferrodoxin [Candidatus Verstraetearchaeota archaeon]
MTERLQVYKCEICGNIVMVLHAGKGQLVCCGKPMTLFEEKTIDVGKEKHVPVVEKTSEGLLIKVGSTEHPMEEKHYIEWIQVIKGDITAISFLKPGMKPEFLIKPETFLEIERAREYCNIHGLWSNKK